jgi:hypothetical protein
MVTRSVRVVCVQATDLQHSQSHGIPNVTKTAAAHSLGCTVKSMEIRVMEERITGPDINNGSNPLSSVRRQPSMFDKHSRPVTQALTDSELTSQHHNDNPSTVLPVRCDTCGHARTLTRTSRLLRSRICVPKRFSQPRSSWQPSGSENWRTMDSTQVTTHSLFSHSYSIRWSHTAWIAVMLS